MRGVVVLSFAARQLWADASVSFALVAPYLPTEKPSNPERDYRLIGPIPRGIWQEKYNARTSVERAYSEEKGSHRLANPRVRGLSRVKTHVYLALCAQVIKRIGVMERLISCAMPRDEGLENLKKMAEP